jgi:hypothetical protein
MRLPRAGALLAATVWARLLLPGAEAAGESSGCERCSKTPRDLKEMSKDVQKNRSIGTRDGRGLWKLGGSLTPAIEF